MTTWTRRPARFSYFPKHSTPSTISPQLPPCPTSKMTGSHSPSEIISVLLRVAEERIVPLTEEGVSSGSKVFGAAVLARDDLRALTVATNDERVSPLLHGEINCIQQFFASPSEGRPATKDCVLFSTHEPCSLCLSGIAWAGITEFYYMFTYEDSRDLFSIPYDIDILEEVFRVRAPGDTAETLAARPLYNPKNKFFTAISLGELLGQIADEEERKKWAGEVARVRELYKALDETYQEGKKAGTESASVWK